MDLTTALIAAVAIFIGTILQRLSGTGVGLVVAPILTVLLGPVAGILVTNATTVVSGLLILLSLRRNIEWKRYLGFLPGIIVGAIAASFVVRAAPASWLQILIGAIVLLALATTFGVPNLPVVRTRALGPVTGAVGGFFNTCAGVAAPVMVIDATLTRWNQTSFAATMQPTFLTMGLLSVISKISLGATTLAELPPLWTFGVIIVIVVAGIVIGSILSSRVSSRAARNTAITLAAIGGAAALIRGVVAL
ncbi:sulfite exporter TauE/SafE family protein [Microbacterium sp. MPKO10]|uniref:sulfite exporter TauE/SafE family protein n=1 Tax=Microbacterium sp. MPKO10 TaxID=2989818 RepID=UPI002235ABA7|nr:sulfite exporter TauE/SafE family protein [Microbacterium sp. MPKO10]MCW4457848.1 sulfite exporter TauE/SafE family protein [Microbacterium sp. MPKO10]